MKYLFLRHNNSPPDNRSSTDFRV